MDVQAHTTPESRKALRNYLRQRRMTTSIHQTISMQTLNDLEEALRLLKGVRESPEWWREEVDAFLTQREPSAVGRGEVYFDGVFAGTLTAGAKVLA